MRLQKKSLSKVALADLLRRRHTSLEKFLTDNGIETYELLVMRCNSLGVLPPTHEQFLKVKGGHQVPEISSPTEGVVVIHPLVEDVAEPEEKIEEAPQKQQKKKRESKAHNSD